MRAYNSTYIEELEQRVHPRDGEKEFCMIEAYMDESGIHDGAHVCVIAGYWGTVKKWKKFENRWKAILRDANEPTLVEFHSTDFWHKDDSRKGVFARWSNQKADRFIDDLASCIVDAKIFPTFCSVVMDEWKKLNKNERRFLTGGRYDTKTHNWVTQGAPNKPYFWPFQVAILNPVLACPAGLHVHYTFDLNKQFKNYAVDLYALLKSDSSFTHRHKLGSLDMEIGEVAVGLQAADLLAYRQYKLAKTRLERGKPMPFESAPKLIKKLLTNIRDPRDLVFYDKHNLDIALRGLSPKLRGEQ